MLLSFETSSQFGFVRQTPSLLLRLVLKRSFLIKPVVGAESGDPEPSLSYAAASEEPPMMHRAPFLYSSLFNSTDFKEP